MSERLVSDASDHAEGYAVVDKAHRIICSRCRGGAEADTDEIWQEIEANPLLSGITFSGGDPLFQPRPLLELAKKAKQLGLDAIHDTVHEMARDEARHGKAFEGLLNRYFK